MAPTAAQALAGSNRDVVANRRFIRMANMSAAEVLKAELAGLVPVKKSASTFTSTATPAVPTPQPTTATAAATSASTSEHEPEPDHDELPPALAAAIEEDDAEVPGLGGPGPNASETTVNMQVDAVAETTNGDQVMDDVAPSETSSLGTKRKREVVEEEDAAEAEETVEVDDEEDAPPDVETAAISYALKVNADGTVDQEDTVKYVVSRISASFYANWRYVGSGSLATRTGTINRSSALTTTTLKLEESTQYLFSCLVCIIDPESQQDCSQVRRGYGMGASILLPWGECFIWRVSIGTHRSPSLDPFVAMVLSVPLCTLCCRFPGHQLDGPKVRAWSTLQAIRATDGCVPCC